MASKSQPLEWPLTEGLTVPVKSSCYDIINIMHYSLKGGTIAVLSVI